MGLGSFCVEQSLCVDYSSLLLWITDKYFLNDDCVYALEQWSVASSTKPEERIPKCFIAT